MMLEKFRMTIVAAALAAGTVFPAFGTGMRRGASSTSANIVDFKVRIFF
jgi:hypothetical protein